MITDVNESETTGTIKLYHTDGGIHETGGDALTSGPIAGEGPCIEVQFGFTYRYKVWKLRPDGEGGFEAFQVWKYKKKWTDTEDVCECP